MWSSVNEGILREFGEKASILRILHLRQSQWLNRMDKWFVLPSLLLGMASAAMQTTMDAEPEHVKYTSAALSLCSVMLISANKHMKFAERADSHKASSHVYAKTYRFVTTELALDRDTREKPVALLKKVRDQMGFATEHAPLIDRHIVDAFLCTFENPDDISLPEICNGLRRIKIRGAPSFRSLQDVETGPVTGGGSDVTGEPAEDLAIA